MAQRQPQKLDLATYVIKTIINPMKEAEARRLNRTLAEINTRNRVLSKLSHDGFIFDGEFYMPAIPGRQIPNVNQQKPTLHVSLWPEIEEFRKDRDLTKTDIQMVQQVLFLLVSGQTTWQDMRDALPDLFSEICPEIRALPRTRPEGFSLNGNERHLRQFEAMKERMAVYLVARLMY
jgi:hypothetical protein